MKATICFLLILHISCTVTKKSATGIQFAANSVIAHRGAFKQNNFPENSIAALREAIRLNCTGSEFDVRMTADDSLIINHDPHYQQLEIEKSTYQQLAKFPLSNGEMLPTLRQYLLEGVSNNQRTRLVVEIKPSGISKERGKLIADKAVQLIRALNVEKMVVYISFDYDILKRIREIDAHASTQYLNGDRTPDQLKLDGINGADYHFSVFRNNPGWIAMAKKAGIVLNAWTVNTKEDMQWLLEQQFDFITTNEPELLLTITQSK
ncbi:MAG: glycerophosphodiester phosphodiesterase family protein [Chitinophagaceae bacterium]